MAHIAYVTEEKIPEADRIEDRDNILRIHGVHSWVIRQHCDLYVQLMHRPGPLSREQREMIGVAVSAANACHY